MTNSKEGGIGRTSKESEEEEFSLGSGGKKRDAREMPGTTSQPDMEEAGK